VWQALRQELAPQGFELVTVGMDTLGAEGCRAFIEAAQPQHPSLLDEHHVLAEQFGVVNIPSAFWIDEQGMIVRPPEAAPAPPKAAPDEPPPAPEAAAEMPERFVQMMGEAMKIESDPETYHAALKDWVAKGAASEYAMTPEQVIERSRPRDADNALGHAHFELASALHQRGDESAAVPHFREAHRLVPDSWTFRRQAWSLKPVGDGPFARFWQGPVPGQEADWPYEGDWLTDIRKVGAEHYNDPWQP
jgi:hypothetical protein